MKKTIYFPKYAKTGLIPALLLLFAFQNLFAQQHLYWNDFYGKIQKSALDGSNVEDVLTGLNGPESMDIDNKEEMMFILAGGFTPDILTANLDGSGLTTIIPNASTILQFGFGLDQESKKIYYPDGVDIVRADYNGNNIEMVVLNQPGAKDIAVDPEEEKIYWIDDVENKVKRANLNGTNIEDLITTGIDFPIEITLDTMNHKIYWSDSGEEAIKRANLDGSNVEIVVDENSFSTHSNEFKSGSLITDPFYPRGLHLDTYQQELYFTNLFNESVNLYDLLNDALTTLVNLPVGQSSATSVVVGGNDPCHPDLVPPVAKCKKEDIIIEIDDFGEASVSANDIDDGSSDNCPDLALFVSPGEFNCSMLGIQAVTLTASDFGDNEDQCIAIVIVIAPDKDADGSNFCDDCDDDNPNIQGPITWYLDGDGDGYEASSPSMEACLQPFGYVDNNSDCDDNDVSVFEPKDWYKDGDMDGFGGNELLVACDQPMGFVGITGDCDDANGAVHPNAAEVCDGIDNDCDGKTDDADDSVAGQKTWYRDADNDGFGDPDMMVKACFKPDGYVDKEGDCRDNNSAVNPEAQEICDNFDNDCDGDWNDLDDDIEYTDEFKWYRDVDADGWGNVIDWVYHCNLPSGYTEKPGDCDDNDHTVYPDAPEICDAKDNDCDGKTDDEDDHVTGLTTWYLDLDFDGFGDPFVTDEACVQPNGYVANNTDCDDFDHTVFPGAPEICDGQDNDCDNKIDDQDGDVVGQKTWYWDSDGDGFGNPNLVEMTCNQPDGFVDKAGDCNDADSAIHPGATELCDGIDNDCDNKIDSDDDNLGDATTWYLDHDNDLFGDPNMTKEACEKPDGYVGNSADCDDSNPFTNPETTEVCDGLDNDCDGLIDDDDPNVFYSTDDVWYKDNDQDGYGGMEEQVSACNAPSLSGWSKLNNDCNDTNEAVYPGADEICDGIDNDCDGKVDDDDEDVVGQQAWYEDNDGDGFGAGAAIFACNQPGGRVANNLDFDDKDASRFPGAPEICDGIDNDGDDLIDTEDDDYVDDEPPFARCKDTIEVLLNDDGFVEITPTMIDTSSTDNCGIVSLGLDVFLFEEDDLGENVVTLIATDLKGNTSTCTTVVVVNLFVSAINLHQPLLPSLHLFPNPATHSLSVEYKNVQPVLMLINNVAGREMYRFSDNPFPDQLSISHYPAGIYFLTLYDRHGNLLIERFVKTE